MVPGTDPGQPQPLQPGTEGGGGGGGGGRAGGGGAGGRGGGGLREGLLSPPSVTVKLYLYDTCLRLDEGIQDKKYIILHQVEILTTVTSH